VAAAVLIQHPEYYNKATTVGKEATGDISSN